MSKQDDAERFVEAVRVELDRLRSAPAPLTFLADDRIQLDGQGDVLTVEGVGLDWIVYRQPDGQRFLTFCVDRYQRAPEERVEFRGSNWFVADARDDGNHWHITLTDPRSLAVLAEGD